MAETVTTTLLEQILYCQDCFESGRCPPEARREQTTLDNPNVAIVCAECRDKMLSACARFDVWPGKSINL